MKVRALTLIGFCILAWTAQSFPAHADCTSPAGLPGAVTLNGVNAVIWCDGTNWNSLASGGGGSTLAGLTDVDVSSIGNGKVLTYNNTTSKWEPTTPSAALSGGTSGYLGVWTGATTMGLSSTSTSNQLFWDATNHRLGIGTTTPAQKLDVSTAMRVSATATKYSDLFPGFLRLQHTAASGDWAEIDLHAGAAVDSRVWNIAARGDTGSLVLRTFNDARSSNSEIMTLMRNGNVGIGTTTPSSALDISSGTLSILVGADNSAATRTNSTQKAGRIAVPHYLSAQAPALALMGVSDSTDNNIFIGGGSGLANAATTLSFYTASNNTTLTGTRRMFIDASGNVGIGTTSPGYKLDVSGTSIRIANPTSGNTNWSEIDLFSGRTTTDEKVWNIANNAGNGSFQVRALNDARTVETITSPLTILRNGNIGIRTASPNSLLTLNAGSNDGLRINNGTVNGVVFNTSNTSMTIGTVSNHPLNIFANNAAAATILGNGNFGIGTPSPSVKLDVSGAVRIDGNASTNSAELRIANNDASGGSWRIGDGIGAANGSMTIYDSVDSRLVMTINTSGVFACFSGCTNSTSDVRLKTNIIPLANTDGGLAVIEKLRPVSFNWKDTRSDKRTQYGFIAQEVQKVLPDLVTKTNSTSITLADGGQQTIPETLILNSGELIAPLVRSVQELKADNDKLRARLQAANDHDFAQDAAIDDLRREIDALKAAR